MQLPQTFKEHPYAWGFGGFLLLVLLFYWLFKPSTAAAAATGDPNAAYYDAAALAAQSGNALSADQLAANASVNTAQIQAGTQSAAIGAAASVANQQTVTQGQTAQDYINALLQLGSGQIASQNYQAMALTGTQLGLAGLASGTDTGAGIAATQSAGLLDFNPTLTAAQQANVNSSLWRIFGFNPQTGPAPGDVYGANFTATPGVGNIPALPQPMTLPVTAGGSPVAGGFSIQSTPAANSNTPIQAQTVIGNTLAA